MDKRNEILCLCDWCPLFDAKHEMSSLVCEIDRDIGIESLIHTLVHEQSIPKFSPISKQLLIDGFSHEEMFETLLDLLKSQLIVKHGDSVCQFGLFMKSEYSRMILPAMCGIVDDLSMIPCKIMRFDSLNDATGINILSTMFDLEYNFTQDSPEDLVSVKLLLEDTTDNWLKVSISKKCRILRVCFATMASIEMFQTLDLDRQISLVSALCAKLFIMWFDRSTEPIFVILSEAQNNVISIALRGIRTLSLSPQCYIDYYTIKIQETSTFQLFDQKANRGGFDSNCTDHLFLLLGQSNMSGRGQASDLRTDYDPESNCLKYPFLDSNYLSLSKEYVNDITFYDPIDSWKICEILDIHKNVDIKKKTGIGPAISFAFKYLANQRSKREKLSEPEVRVGLIPASIGGSFLYEWMASYLPQPKNKCDNNALSLNSLKTIEEQLVDPCYSLDTEGRILPPDNARYQRGCLNLLSCSMKSLFAAITKKRSSSTEFRGILFYQGESDCSLDETAAQSYGTRLDMFLRDLNINLKLIFLAVDKLSEGDIIKRGEDHFRCRMCNISCSIVAVTSTRPSLFSIKQIRQQQLGFHSNARATHMKEYKDSLQIQSIVDSFSLPLRNDNIHLTAQSSIALGIAIANSFNQDDECPIRPSIPCLTSLIEILQSKDFDDSLLDFYIASIRAKAIELIQQKQLKAKQYIKSNLHCILASGCNVGNFVYGEINLLSFLKILRCIENIPDDASALGTRCNGAIFVDLGCGAGCGVIAALLHSLRSSKPRKGFSNDLDPWDVLNSFSTSSMIAFTKIIGIDLMSSKIEECKETIELLGCQEISAEKSQFCRYNMLQTGHTIDIELYTENILTVDWLHASVVVACSTCFDSQFMAMLNAKFCQLQQGTIVVLMDKLDLSDESFSSDFIMITSFQCSTSWGTGNAFIYKKV